MMKRSARKIINYCGFFLLTGQTGVWPQNTTLPSNASYTPLQVIVSIGVAAKTPIGILFGVSPSLCEQRRQFSSNGQDIIASLREAVSGTGYTVRYDSGVYLIEAPDLTSREQEVKITKISTFVTPSSTMSYLGATLTGYISTTIEGATGYSLQVLGSPQDEVLSLKKMENKTAPEIANEIVKLGAKGIWTMSAAKNDIGKKPGSTTIEIYDFHDSQATLSKLSCPNPIIKPK